MTESLPVDDDDPRLLHILGMVAPIERGAHVRAGLAARRPGDVDDPGLQVLLGVVAGTVGDQEASAAFLAASVRSLRAAGRLGELTNALIAQAWAGWHRGTWDDAAAQADEAARLGEQTERPGTVMASQLLAGPAGGGAGCHGRRPGHDRRARWAAAGVGGGNPGGHDRLRAGHGAPAGGRAHDEAYEAMRAVEAIGHADEVAAIHQGTAPAYVDAALATGRIDAARAVLADLEDLQARFGSPTLDATIAYARPLRRRRRSRPRNCSWRPTAALVSWPFLRARSLLAHGSWLRRQRRAADAAAAVAAPPATLCDALGRPPVGRPGPPRAARRRRV